MSGAEAAAVLGVISSIIAIVDATKKIYDGASDASGLPEAFREVSARLPVVLDIIISAQQHIRDNKVDEDSCRAAKPLIEKCLGRAKALDGIFQKVIPQDDASWLERYLKAARSLGKEGKVEALMKGLLDDLLLLTSQRGFESATAHQVDQLAKAIHDLSNIETSIPDSAFEDASFTNNNFGNGPMTNNNVMGNQKYQANYGTGKQFQAETQTFNMENKDSSVQTYNAQVQQFFSRNLNNEELQTACENAVLDQLRFHGMDEKYHRIPKAHKETFQWIYGRPELRFVEWLHTGKGVYWITGKAGSGKSTLMKFLFEDPRMSDLLQKDGDDASIFSFFFHDLEDNPILKSQHGLFRAIMYRILSKYKQLIPIVFRDRWESIKAEISSGVHRTRGFEWSLAELRAGFKEVISQGSVRLRLCLLIDGLDEFSGQYGDIIDTLSELIPPPESKHVRVQLCVSSRPLTVFEKAYSQCPHLRVQDLSKDDIERYITSNFNDVPELREMQIRDPTTTSHIVQEILRKAEGVFLWVTLVVRSLIESLENYDDTKRLLSRLSALPAGLRPLYSHMMGQIDPFYRPDAARLFRIVRFALRPLSPLAISFAEDSPEIALRTASVLTAGDIADRHLKAEKHLRARTAGLVEVSSLEQGQSTDPSTGKRGLDVQHGRLRKRIWKPSEVQFFHLTVKEFIVSDDVPEWLLSQPQENLADTHRYIVACCLRECGTTLSHYTYASMRRSAQNTPELADRFHAHEAGLIYLIMFHAREVERLTNTSQLPYLEVLEDLIKRYEPRIPKGVSGSNDHRNEQRDRGVWHWTMDRYGDWSEPQRWSSDYVSYLVTIGMTRSVIQKFRNGYDPSKKPGRPLLLYATCTLAPDNANEGLERDPLDPVIVEELLKRNCDPNQIFESDPAHDMRVYGQRTVWEAVLFHVHARFSNGWPRTKYGRRYETYLENTKGVIDYLKLRWLRVIKLFLDYGADPMLFIDRYEYLEYRHGMRKVSRASGILLFNEIFADFDDPLVKEIQDFMIAKGATEIREEVSTMEGQESQPEQLPTPSIGIRITDRLSHSRSVQFIRKTLATRRLRRSEGIAEGEEGRERFGGGGDEVNK